MEAGCTLLRKGTHAFPRLSGVVVLVLCGVALSIRQAGAQLRQDSAAAESRWPFQVTLSIGAGGPSGDTRCLEGAYLFPGVEFATRAQVFVAASGEWVLPFGPTEDCLRVPPAQETSDGAVLAHGDDRFNLESGGVHFQSGVGYRGPFGLETMAELGAARGQKDYRSAWLVSATATLGLSLWHDHLMVSVDRRWFRIPYWAQRFGTEQEWLE